MRKHHAAKQLLRAVLGILGGFSKKTGVKRLETLCNSRKILILLWNRKAWLLSQAFDMGMSGEDTHCIYGGWRRCSSL